jgi:membrane associated rhomboid family serine protease
MLAKFLRRWFGGVRFFLTLLTALSGLAVVFLDVFLHLNLSASIYGFLAALIGQVAVFIVKDSQRASGAQIPGYYGSAGNPTDRIGGAD